TGVMGTSFSRYPVPSPAATAVRVRRRSRLDRRHLQHLPLLCLLSAAGEDAATEFRDDRAGFVLEESLT
ncbi:hypothetical protein PFISCL1PPCAC_24733, partial [Pristionchus fissidentatus]